MWALWNKIYLIESSSWKFYEVRSETVVWKGGFQLMQIVVFLGMYFDAVVVEVKKNLLLFRLALAYCAGPYK